MSVYSGDFLGFSLGNFHSSQLNITRVSSGDRYTETLTPTFQDQTVQIPGGDGSYYFDTFFTQKTITIDFAFDDLRDEDIRILKQLFNFKGVKPLIFDETPYKKYMVKAGTPPQIKFVPFDFLEFRVYKGEGSVQLIAYYPYALGIVTTTVVPTLVGGLYNGAINNNGDLPAILEVIYELPSLSNGAVITLKDANGIEIKTLELSSVSPKEGDTYISINNHTHLIEGLDSNFSKTGHIYNEYINSGDFFEPPVGNTRLYSTTEVHKFKYTPVFY